MKQPVKFVATLFSVLLHGLLVAVLLNWELKTEQTDNLSQASFVVHTVPKLANRTAETLPTAGFQVGERPKNNAFLEMTGWVWDLPPHIRDTSDEIGKISFEMKVDKEGEVISVKTVFCTISHNLAALYEKAVYDLTFSPLPGQPRPKGNSEGKITFIIKTK